MADLAPLAKHLAVSFSGEAGIRTALTHRSYGQPHNERLEFLGDALLNCMIAEALFQRFPSAREGDLTRLRAQLVKGETLAEMAKQMELGQYLRLGGGELKSGGWRRASILADAFEALIAALYLDLGMEICRQVVLRLFQPRLDALSLDDVDKDCKTRLQEYLQSRNLPLPEYRLLTVTGEAHNQFFEVECATQPSARTFIGKAQNRRRAEQIAAEAALAHLLKVS